MMEKTFLQRQASTGSLSAVFPVIDESRLVAAYVTVEDTSAQGASAQIALGKSGATHNVLVADLGGAVNGTTTTAAYHSSVTEAEKYQVFDTSTPITVTGSNLNSSTQVGIWLVTDPFVIGQRVGLSS